MISQVNYFVPSPVVIQKPVAVQSPSFVFVKIRCFRTSRTTHHPNLTLTEKALPSTSLSASRISRFVRTEAQEALFDYLHCTRNFYFADAEHISKNSPAFLQKLLSKIENEQHIARSLSKYFRYNPINEFEPFFESLGLTPSEFFSLLPRDLIFLSDDHVMLDNFHVLCDYGIPRSMIGKIFKEAKEVLGLDYGVLARKLQAYEELGLGTSTVIKLVSCCPSLLTSGINSEFIRVFEKLSGLGMKNDWIGGHLTNKSIYNWNRMLDTMEFLDKVGYSKEKIRTLFKTDPALLFEGSGKKIYILVGGLLKLGLSMNQVANLISQNPQILSRKFAQKLWRAVSFLLDIGMEMEEIGNIVSTHMQLMISHSLNGPKTVLRKLKVGRDGLCQIIKDDPNKMFILASKSSGINIEQKAGKNPSKILEKTAFLLRLGYTENSDEMVKALKQFRGRGDQLQERFDCLVQAGLDCNAVSNMIKQAPSVLNQTKDVLEKKIDCLQNCLGYPLESVVAFPAYLCYDMERINLRFSMYAWLRERNAAKHMLSLSTLLACSDKRFVKYFVSVHPEGSTIWESLKKSSSLC
ncbi:transcription termination factor MTEF18, mitochondrial-like [Malania oleifera]|uniref:transcription termination factor MTEF18, mitochondrial-like n=1 Tax=Malania oleifera TaxID=397392 RepID=UPI0025ADEA4D|nr:transcription termination factor MTEF18, mitochondrial-like [Malania oleifera]